MSKVFISFYKSATLNRAASDITCSTGGIIALALGIMDWSVDNYMEPFLKLVDKAFTSKFLGRVTFGNPNYRTRPLQEALFESFREKTMFGGRRDIPVACGRKVAVTSVKRTGEQAVIFTDYNRKEDKEGMFKY